MMGLGWTEMLVIGVVALIFIGPKDLPMVMGRIGKFMGQIRRMGNEFQREINRSTGLDEVRNLRQSITSPLKKTADEIRRDFNTMTPTGAKPSGAIQPTDPKTESVVDALKTQAGMTPAAEPVKAVQVTPAPAAKAAPTAPVKSATLPPVSETPVAEVQAKPVKTGAASAKKPAATKAKAAAAKTATAAEAQDAPVKTGAAKKPAAARKPKAAPADAEAKPAAKPRAKTAKPAVDDAAKPAPKPRAPRKAKPATPSENS